MTRSARSPKKDWVGGWKSDDPRDPDSDLHQGRRPRAAKDRRRWCRGRVGVPHQPHTVKGQWAMRPCGPAVPSRLPERWVCWHVVACAVCGKHLSLPGACECPDRPDKKAGTA